MIASGTADDLVEEVTARALAAGDEGAAAAGEQLTASVAAVAQTPQEAALPGAGQARGRARDPDAATTDTGSPATST
ncbi:hypothetical protein BJF83_17715 [Nocardiopsis sp. CNR-923]|nr:hypothetical protein BJF83_17715 [Nocardiopsis sp. CNR-923]